MLRESIILSSVVKPEHTENARFFLCMAMKIGPYVLHANAEIEPQKVLTGAAKHLSEENET